MLRRWLWKELHGRMAMRGRERGVSRWTDRRWMLVLRKSTHRSSLDRSGVDSDIILQPTSQVHEPNSSATSMIVEALNSVQVSMDPCLVPNCSNMM